MPDECLPHTFDRSHPKKRAATQCIIHSTMRKSIFLFVPSWPRWDTSFILWKPVCLPPMLLCLEHNVVPTEVIQTSSVDWFSWQTMLPMSDGRTKGKGFRIDPQFPQGLHRKTVSNLGTESGRAISCSYFSLIVLWKIPCDQVQSASCQVPTNLIIQNPWEQYSNKEIFPSWAWC